MTDDEIREKVARALYEQFTLNWWNDRQGDEASGTTPPQPPSFDEAKPSTNWGDSKLYAKAYAKTALTASGYWEIRRALERSIDTLKTARERLEQTGHMSAAADCTEDIEIASVALSKAGET